MPATSSEPADRVLEAAAVDVEADGVDDAARTGAPRASGTSGPRPRSPPARSVAWDAEPGRQPRERPLRCRRSGRLLLLAGRTARRVPRARRAWPRSADFCDSSLALVAYMSTYSWPDSCMISYMISSVIARRM